VGLGYLLARASGERTMQALIIAGALGFLIAQAFAQSTTTQRSRDGLDARARAIQECMALNKRNNTDPYGAAGGAEHMYKGQRP
jgi:hypothetical protein